MKTLLMTLSLALLTNAAFADAGKLTIDTFEVEEFSHESQQKSLGDVAGAGGGAPGPIIPDIGIGGGGVGPGPGPITGGLGTSGFDRVGQVISVAQSIVALGESVYNLVQKGKPHNTTEYAPVSIVPKDPISKEALDPFELENCSFPTTKKFKTNITSGGATVVTFEYMVVYVKGCSYNGVGNYIQALMIQPVNIKTSYGWDVNASMKLTGIMNHGSKTDPNVGALMTIKYSMNSWRTAFEKNDTIHITGKGEFKTYSR